MTLDLEAIRARRAAEPERQWPTQEQSDIDALIAEVERQRQVIDQYEAALDRWISLDALVHSVEE